MLHMSWHQCHCDLYRPFLTDYPELGPHAVLNGMCESDRVMMRDKCLGHAEQIVRVLTDFIQHKEEQHMLEHDAAVCTYHAARLVLFGTYHAPHDSEFQMQMAMNKAQMCLDVIKRYFSFSAQLESMVRDMAPLLHTLLINSSDKPSRKQLITTKRAGNLMVL